MVAAGSCCGHGSGLESSRRPGTCQPAQIHAKMTVRRKFENWQREGMVFFLVHLLSWSAAAHRLPIARTPFCKESGLEPSRVTNSFLLQSDTHVACRAGSLNSVRCTHLFHKGR